MTMKYPLFRHLLTNQVHNIFYNETYILIYVIINFQKILIILVNNDIGHFWRLHRNILAPINLKK